MPITLARTTFWLGAAAVVLAVVAVFTDPVTVGGLAALVGGAAWYTQHRFTANQDAALKRFKTESAAAISATEKELLEVKKSLAQRSIAITSGRGGGSRELLGRFAGTTFVLEVAQDDEARRLAGQIRMALDESGWVCGDALTGEPPDGVTVQTRRVDDTALMETQGRAHVAGAELAEYLEANDLDIRSLIEFGGRAPADAVLIRIGSRPPPPPRFSEETAGVTPEPFRSAVKAMQTERTNQLKRKWRLDPNWLESPE